MSKLWKSVFGLWVIGLGLAVNAPAQAVSAAGPYYATPSWDQTLPASTRFIVLTNMNSQAVLDRETGLVWDQSPSALFAYSWTDASFHCNNLSLGNRKGWRLPTMQDLESLIDPTQSNPALPPGHPFSNVQLTRYWAATTLADDATFALAVYLDTGQAGVGSKSGNALFAWCVRGGSAVDLQ